MKRGSAESGDDGPPEDDQSTKKSFTGKGKERARTPPRQPPSSSEAEQLPGDQGSSSSHSVSFLGVEFKFSGASGLIKGFEAVIAKANRTGADTHAAHLARIAQIRAGSEANVAISTAWSAGIAADDAQGASDEAALYSRQARIAAQRARQIEDEARQIQNEIRLIEEDIRREAEAGAPPPPPNPALIVALQADPLSYLPRGLREDAESEHGTVFGTGVGSEPELTGVPLCEPVGGLANLPDDSGAGPMPD